jgi:hypothetical protein
VPRTASGLWLVPRAGLRHKQREKRQRGSGHDGQNDEPGGKPEPVDDESAREIAQSRPDANRERGGALREVEAPRPTHEIRRNDNGNDSEDASGNAVKQLDGDHRVGVIRQREKQAANGQHHERHHENLLAAYACLHCAPHACGNDHHHELSGNHACA